MNEKIKIAKKWMAEEYDLIRVLDKGSLYLRDFLKKKWKPPVIYSEFSPELIKEHIWTNESKQLIVEEKILDMNSLELLDYPLVLHNMHTFCIS